MLVNSPDWADENQLKCWEGMFFLGSELFSIFHFKSAILANLRHNQVLDFLHRVYSYQS